MIILPLNVPLSNSGLFKLYHASTQEVLLLFSNFKVKTLRYSEILVTENVHSNFDFYLFIYLFMYLFIYLFVNSLSRLKKNILGLSD